MCRSFRSGLTKRRTASRTKIDWTQTWAKKYPILVRYQSRVNIPHYAARLNAMLEELRREYGFDEQDAMLVLKDILAQVWKSRKKQK